MGSLTYSNKTALITGASAGIGACFARQLAAEKTNLILVARRRERLDGLATELSKAHNVKVDVIVADLADPAAPDKIMDQLRARHLQVDILINNAGFGLGGDYIDHNWQTQRDFIELMVTSYAALTHHCLGDMVERGYGRIIQVASVAGLVPGSRGHTLYGASKAFLVSFAQSLSAEYRDKGVQTTALCPGFTYTEFHDVNGTRERLNQLPWIMMLQPEPIVKGALRAVDHNHVVYVPDLIYKTIVWLSNALPAFMVNALMIRNSSKFRDTKKV